MYVYLYDLQLYDIGQQGGGTEETPLHQSFSHDDMEKMFLKPNTFSVAELLAGSEPVEASAFERLPSKPSLSEYYHVDESDYASMLA